MKWTLGGVLAALIAFGVLAGTGAYYFLRHLETGKAGEAETLKQFEGIRARFPERPPLVEIINPQAGDVRVNRLVHPEGRRPTDLHVLTWEAENGQRLETDVPLWLMRFSSLNVLSRLGIAPSRYRLTVQDIIRYGPGIVVDFRRPGQNHVLVWVE